MKPLRWWVPVGAAVVALLFGLVPYLILTATGKIPPGLRDNPWPMELAAVLATGAVVLVAVRAYREKRVRAAATVSAALATLGTAAFLFLIHVATYALPPAPKELAVGTVAPDFILPDEEGRPVSLAAFRGHPTVLVFYRGAW
jgi:cytochrome oxidase Cu insertion factor (SCO1/SenC/PrrC family)